MKLSIITTAALSLTAAAVPHRRGLHHHHRRNLVVETVTEVVKTTEPAAVVYVNQRREPQDITMWYQTITTTAAPAPSTSLATTSSYRAAATTTKKGHKGHSTASSGGYHNGLSGHGISYDPYDSTNGCKSESQIQTDFDRISGYRYVRIYGVDCTQVPYVMSIAKAKGMHVFLGVYDIDQAASETQELISGVNGDWSMVDAVSIGNEAVLNNLATVSDVVSAVTASRSALSAAGYSGPVLTVDAWDIMVANPQLCEVSDFAGANAHAFFDSDCSASGAGTYVSGIAKKVQQACGGKTTVITESGWPSWGQTNGNAVPSQENQEAAINSLKSEMSDNLVIFEAYNDLWQTNNPSTFGAQQFWGIYGNSTSD